MKVTIVVADTETGEGLPRPGSPIIEPVHLYRGSDLGSYGWVQEPLGGCKWDGAPQRITIFPDGHWEAS